MNVSDFKNHDEGGSDYVLENKNGEQKSFNLYKNVIEELKKKYKDEFNLVLFTHKPNEEDFYLIPFSKLKNLFTENNLIKGKYRNRWVVTVNDNHTLKVINSESKQDINISPYYSSNNKPKLFNLDVDEDYFIENARAEINIRLNQSKFRKEVLDNFGNKCAITGISETSLLVASHIVPWSKDKSKRGDVSNGICLYVEIDALFDKGFISFSDNLEIITIDTTNLSKPLKEKIDALKGKKLNPTLKKDINKEYLKTHREEIFSKNKI